MRPRDILAANLKALMASRASLDTLPKITAASGVSNGTLDRMRRAAAAVRVDDIELVAQAFNLRAWQLLVPNLDPANPPSVYRPTEKEEALYRRIQRELDKLGAMRGLASTRPGPLEEDC